MRKLAARAALTLRDVKVYEEGPYPLELQIHRQLIFSDNWIDEVEVLQNGKQDESTEVKWDAACLCYHRYLWNGDKRPFIESPNGSTKE